MQRAALSTREDRRHVLYDVPRRNFRKLVVWQRAHQLALEIHRAVAVLGPRHRFGVGDQMIRSTGSIPANIAEGAGRESFKEFRRFPTIALGSAAERGNHLFLARDLGLISDDGARAYLDEVAQIGSMPIGLRSGVLS